MFSKIMFKETSITIFKGKTEGRNPSSREAGFTSSTGYNVEQLQLNLKTENNTTTKHKYLVSKMPKRPMKIAFYVDIFW